MSDLLNFKWYAPRVLKIQTKSNGMQPFKLRKIQLKYLDHLKNDFPDGIIRSICLKARQVGQSTLIAGINTHNTITRYNHNGIVMADKYDRSQAVFGIYKRLITNIPDRLKPMIAKFNDHEIIFDNPNSFQRTTKPGLGSSLIAETGMDQDAGKSASRQWAHLSEYAFYQFSSEIDQSVQNSIPLAKGTMIVKESTANGMGSTGESFYNQWVAAERGEYLYKPFFVAWYDVEDYRMNVPRGFILDKEEIDLIKRCPDITNENLAWRRYKISEIMTSADSYLTPSELFKQDFPSFPEEAFLSSGNPVFDIEKINRDILKLKANPPPLITVKHTKKYISMYAKSLKVYVTPKAGEKYFIGADVAMGLQGGDYSHAKIIDSNMREVANFHAHLDPDHFGRVLVELAMTYNKALITPEKNAMGHTTLNAIKEMGYLRIYTSAIQDEIEENKLTHKLGWTTTAKSKQVMLNALIASYRDGEIEIRDIDTLREMLGVTRESNGDVVLNSKDRIVATCLAIMGTTQGYESATVYSPDKPKKLIFETMDKSREEIAKLDKKKKSVFSLEDY